jgi:serine/threonine protein kinase
MTFGLVGKKPQEDSWKQLWAEVRAGLLIFYQYNKSKSRGQPCPFAIVPLLGCTVYSRTVDQCRAEKEREGQSSDGHLRRRGQQESRVTTETAEECPCKSAYEAASQTQKSAAIKSRSNSDRHEDGPLVLQLQPNPEFLHRSADPAHGSSFRSIKMRFRTVEELFHWHHVLSLYSAQRVVTRADFDLLCLLGRGAFGQVALARDLLGSGALVSIKFIDKCMIFSSKDKLRRMVDERLILQAVTGKPFFVRLLYAFETGDSLCMVNDFCEGGDLFHFLSVFAQQRERQWRAREEAGEKIDWDRFRRMRRALPVPVARFIAAEILVALEFLHRSDIVYRDLKPENVLFDQDGHIRLTDFGLARILETLPAQADATASDDPVSIHGGVQYIKPGRHAISDVSSPSSSSSSSTSPDNSFAAALDDLGDHGLDAGDKFGDPGSTNSSGVAGTSPAPASGEPTYVRQRATSFCGTKSYISPEMLKTRARLLHGYGFSVDIWAYGVLLYDMLVGRPPFYSSDRERSFALTMTARLSIPDFVDEASADLLARLLEKNERRRIGCHSTYATDFEEIKRHPFFHGIDWSLVQERRLPVPSEITEVLQLGPDAARKAGADTNQINWLVRNFDRRFTESDMDSLIASLNRSFDDSFPRIGAGASAQVATKNADPNACKRSCAGSIPGFMFTYEAAVAGASSAKAQPRDSKSLV